MDFYRYIFPAVAAFSLSLVLTLLALRLFPRWGLMDKPRKYGLKRKPIPYSGGVVIFLAFALSVALFLKLSAAVAGLLFGGFLIVLISFLDDLYDLSPWIRLAVQFLAGVIVVASGVGIPAITNPFGGAIALDQWQVPLSLGDFTFTFVVIADLFVIFWIMVMTNTMNWLDGVSGLPSGITVIGALVLFFLSIKPNFHVIDQSQMAMITIILAATVLAFWIFDFAPPSILMGDSGSMFLGYALAVLAVFAGGKITTAFLVMGFPILDLIWVIGRRIIQGKSPMRGDLKHFHHRLLHLGWSKRQILIFIYIVSFLFGMIALMTDSAAKLFAVIVLVFVMVVIGGTVVHLSRKKLSK